MPKDPPELVRLRKLIGELPETSEKLSHGSPTFWGGKKTFCTWVDNHHGDGRRGIWVKSSFDAQDVLVRSDPDRYFIPPYVGPRGWVGMRLERRPDWNAVRTLLLDGYRMVAPRRALALLEAGQKPDS